MLVETVFQPQSPLLADAPNVEVGIAAAAGPTGAEGGERAAREALVSIRSHRPSCVLVFASPANDLPAVLEGVRRAVPGTPIAGTTTAGEICGCPRQGSVTVAILASPFLRVRVGVGERVAGDWSAALDQAITAPQLAPYFDGSPGPWGELAGKGRSAFALLFTPGNTRRSVSRSFEILEALKRRTLGRLPIFGGAAADDWRMEENQVLWVGGAVPDGVLVALFETELQFGIGIGHGFRAMPARATVTAAEGHELLALDGEPAADAIARLLGTGRKELEGQHVTFASGRVLGSPDPLGGYVPTVASYLTPRGGVLVTRALAPGSQVAVLEVGETTAVTAAPEAVRKARLRGAISSPAIGLVSYCAVRPKLLGDAWRSELPRMEEALGGAPLVGFLGFGEQGPSDDGVPQHTNAVVSALVLGQELSFGAHAAREAESLRARAQEDLEGLVAERTAELRAANVSLAQEIAQRRSAEEAARRHERALRTLGACNEALVRTTDERRLLEDVCRIIVEVGGYRLAWVGFAEQDERKTVRPVAACGVDDGYVSAVDVVWSDTERGRGPVGTAIRTGRPAIARRISDDASFAAWRAQAERRGFAAMIALPLIGDGAPIGALAIYSADAEALAEERERKLLAELADDLAFGLHVLRVRAERVRMQVRLAEADRLAAVGTLAAGVAHEINNPLAYVLGGLEYVQQELERLAPALAGKACELQAVLGEMRVGGERIRHIVRDLRTFARSGEDVRGDVDVRAVAESALHMARRELEQRARVVKVLCPVPAVRANEARLGQVLLNLLLNAAQAIPPDAPAAHEVRLATRTGERGEVVVEVSDTGQGIPPELLGRIFDPFFTTKPQGIGTGLGLWISRNLVLAAGGELTVESALGVGSTFRVTLPPAPLEPPAPAPAPTPVPAPRRARVLVVDDDPLVAGSIRRALAGEHDVVVETSARAALERIVRGEPFEAIVCDLMMPEMTGMELHAQVARRSPESGARVVFVTGGAFTAEARRYLDAVTNPRLEKPFDAASLRAAIREVLVA